MSNGFDLGDEAMDDFDLASTETLEDLGFISNSQDKRRNVRRNIEEMLEAKALRDNIREIFDDDE